MAARPRRFVGSSKTVTSAKPALLRLSTRAGTLRRMRARLHYWPVVLRTGFQPVLVLGGLATLIAGGSVLGFIGALSKWSTITRVGIGLAVAIVAVAFAALEGAYRLRPETSRPDLRITRGRVGA